MAGHEKRFQNAFVAGLEENGWVFSGSEGCPDYDRVSAIIPSDLKDWVVATQPKEWARLVTKTGSDDAALNLLISKIVQLRKTPHSKGGGTYNLLLNGLLVERIPFKIFYPKPVSSKNKEVVEKYDSMILRVVSELYYSVTKPNDSIDLGFFINGIPVGTAELKSPISGQGVGEAENQYCKDRIPGRDMILHSSQGALFHFAVATDRASLTTALNGDQTRFIPFNTGIDNSAYADASGDYLTSYLWKEVLEKDSLALIVSGMMRNVEDNGVPQTRFPRYHQLDNLKKITGAVKSVGGRKNYLSQHAAGSGKSDEIANLAYALSILHDDSGKRVYDSVIIITNRTVLDDQIAGLLKSKIKLNGYFHRIEKASHGISKSTDLAERLLSVSPPRIMSVTAQTFTGTLIDTMRKQQADQLSGNYAVIIDEAHDGETGKQHENMYKSLLGESLHTMDEEEDIETSPDEDTEAEATVSEEVTTSEIEREHLPALNFFAYTATPNADTLRVFGEKVSDSAGKVVYVPFHSYSMHQAREEGYINDVLANYVTHERYVKINIDDATYEGDRIVDFTEGRKEVGQWMATLPEVKKVIVEIIMQKMQNIVLPSLNGEGKAMLTCSSRSEALIYKHLIDEAIAELPEESRFDTLVAFSGSLFDPVIGEDVTELDPRLNKDLGRSNDLAAVFKRKNFRLMIVADKYQVGFDQPKLVCMFLDKPLRGIRLIQTTARVNRKIPGKENVYIFDFVNDKDTVLESFRKFDEDATLALSVDLSTETLDDLLQKTEVFGIHTDDDITKFYAACMILDDANATESAKNEASKGMSKVVDVCVARAHKLFASASEVAKEGEAGGIADYRVLLRRFNSVYSLLSITRSDLTAIRALYEKYGKQSRFFHSLVRALTVSRGEDTAPSIDVNALILEKCEVVAQGSIGGLTEGEAEVEKANYSGEVSGVEFSSQLGPVEVLINEINDYPEFHGHEEGTIRHLIEVVLTSMKADKDLRGLAESTSNKSFAVSPTVHKKITNILIKYFRDKDSSVSAAAKTIMNTHSHDKTLISKIAIMLYKVLAAENLTDR